MAVTYMTGGLAITRQAETLLEDEGGVAYVYDVEKVFPKNVNKEMVELRKMLTQKI